MNKQNKNKIIVLFSLILIILFSFLINAEGEILEGTVIDTCEEGKRVCSNDKIQICTNGNYVDEDLCNGGGCFISDQSSLPVCRNELTDTCSTVGAIGCFPGEVQSYKVCKAGTPNNEFLTSFCPAGTFCGVLESNDCGTPAGCCFFDEESSEYKCHPIDSNGNADTNKLCKAEINVQNVGVDPGISSLWERSSIGEKYNNFIDDKLNRLFGVGKFDVSKLLCRAKKKNAESYGTTVGNLINYLSLHNFNVHVDGAYASLYESSALYTVSWTIKTNEVPKNLNSGKRKINGAICSFDAECASNFCNSETSYGSLTSGICEGEQKTTQTSINQAVVFLLGDMPLTSLQQIQRGEKLPSDYGDVPLKFISYKGQDIFSANVNSPHIGSVMFDDNNKWDFVCIWFIPTYIDNKENVNNEIFKPGILGCQPIVNKDVPEDINNIETSSFSDSRPLETNSDGSNSIQIVESLNKFIERSRTKELIIETSTGRLSRAPISNVYNTNSQFLVNGKYLGWSKVYKSTGKLERTFLGDFPKASFVREPKDLKDLVNNFFYFAVAGHTGDVVASNSLSLNNQNSNSETIIENPLDLSVNKMVKNGNIIDIEFKYSISQVGSHTPTTLKIDLICERNFEDGFLCPDELKTSNFITETIPSGGSIQKVNELKRVNSNSNVYNAAVVYIDGVEQYKIRIIGANSPLPNDCNKNDNQMISCN